MSADELTIAGLRKSFGSAAVLHGVDLEVSAGSLTAVLGPSGCGKTTLLRLIAGFERADGGSIHLGERVLADARTHLAPERRAIGFVPQEGALFPHLDVAANVGFGLPRSERRGTRVGELLELLGIAELARRLPHQLSGGQQQRVALARALAPGPAVVLLDEPFDALDAGLRVEVRGEVRDALRAAGATGLLVTHDQEEALSLADRVAVMRAGRIVQADEPRRLYRDPVDAEVASFVGEAVLLEAEIGDGAAATALGRLPLRGPRPDAARATVMLRPEQISCHDRDLDGAPRGRVGATEFYGHDASARIVLDSGLEVLARCAGHRLPAPGEEVSILVEGTALAFSSGAPVSELQPAGALSSNR